MSSDDNPVIQVVTACGTRDEAQRLASELVRRRLAACVQVSGPIGSTYFWNGTLEEGLEEWLCMAKTLQSHFPAVEEAIRELHSYDVPEILAVPTVASSADYRAWVEGEVKH